jgi:hypothetical protein
MAHKCDEAMEAAGIQVGETAVVRCTFMVVDSYAYPHKFDDDGESKFNAGYMAFMPLTTEVEYKKIKLVVPVMFLSVIPVPRIGRDTVFNTADNVRRGRIREAVEKQQLLTSKVTGLRIVNLTGRAGLETAEEVQVAEKTAEFVTGITSNNEDVVSLVNDAVGEVTSEDELGLNVLERSFSGLNALAWLRACQKVFAGLGLDYKTVVKYFGLSANYSNERAVKPLFEATKQVDMAALVANGKKVFDYESASKLAKEHGLTDKINAEFLVQLDAVASMPEPTTAPAVVTPPPVEPVEKKTVVVITPPASTDEETFGSYSADEPAAPPPETGSTTREAISTSGVDWNFLNTNNS